MPYSIHLFDLLRKLEPLHVLLGLENSLDVAVALQQALTVKIPLLDVLLASGIDSLQQRLQLRLLVERTRQSDRWCCVRRFSWCQFGFYG